MKMFTLSLLLVFTLLTTGCQADDDYGEHEEGWNFLHKQRDVAAVEDPLYKEECGSCHLAYPPGLLPGSSWKRIMTQLEDHFGDNAELEPGVQKRLTTYLLMHSAERSDYRRSRRIMRSTNEANAPLRITELSYFRHEHDEIPPRLIKGNEKVGSLSNCNACHPRAEQGFFSDREIRIPGYGAWDD